MIKYICIGGMTLIVLSNTQKITSTGAPIGSTGGRDEQHCGRPGCHVGNNNTNTGNGNVSINISDFSGNYIPGKSYELTMRISQNNIKRFGFEAVVLGENNKSIGTLQLLDSVRTQILQGSHQYIDRDYITYTGRGTNPVSENRGEWKFIWTAPSNNEGKAKIYTAFVSADNDGTDKGDEVYTDSLSLSGFANGVEHLQENSLINIYPNPILNQFSLAFNSPQSENTQICLFDISAKKQNDIWNGYLSKGQHILSFQRPFLLASGLYILQVKQENHVYEYKLILE